MGRNSIPQTIKYAQRILLLYRGSGEKFSLVESLVHELKDSTKEKSAMAVSRYCDCDYYNRFVAGTAALLYKPENIRAWYPFDAWTHRVPGYPKRVCRDGGCRKGTSDYEEVVVRGKPFGLLYDPTVLPNKTAKWLAKQWGLKLYPKRYLG